MQNETKSLAAKFRQQHVQKRKIYPILAALALVVTAGTIWGVTQPASTMSGNLICVTEEHTHGEACYERSLICELEEGPEHTHTESCWKSELVCPKDEHTHSAACYDTAEPELEPDGEQTAQPDSSLPEDVTDETQKSDAAGETEAENGQLPEVPEDLRKNVPMEYSDVRAAQIPQGGMVYLFSLPGVIPEQVELQVQPVDESSAAFTQAEQRVKQTGVEYNHITALDILLLDKNGAELEPKAPVYVSIDAGALLPEGTEPESVRIQHHKELLTPVMGDWTEDEAGLPAEQADIVLETVMDETKGILEQNEMTGSWMATFPVDSFSVYTITSKGWPDLNIKIQCVDESSNELIEDHKPADIHWGGNYTPNASFTVPFMSNEHPDIPGYQFDGKAYYMKDGHYNLRIYGLRREGGKWYYYSDDNNKNKKVEFNPQPDFLGENPPDFIRLIYKKVMQVPVQYMDDAGKIGEEIVIDVKDAPGEKNPDIITLTGTEVDVSNADMMPKSQSYFYVGRAYVGKPNPKNEVVKVVREGGKPYAITMEDKKILLKEENPLKLVYHKTQTETPDTMATVSTRDKGLTINLFDYNSGDKYGENEGINAGKYLQFVGDLKRPDEYNRWTGKDGGIYTGIVGDTLVNGYPTVNGQSLDYLFDPEICRNELGNTVEHVHTNLDHLFWQDKDGYYRYDSMTNFATIMDPNEPDGDPAHQPGQTDGGNFTVYQQPALPGVTGTGDNPKFLPFNTYAQANVPTAEPASKEKVKQYHFGMTMEADFIMPPGGVIPDADGAHTGMLDMIFEFNGDDDVWVFVDGKLVLDLGGIHDRYGGTINFRTGEVTTNAPPMEHSGLKQPNLYGIKGDPNAMSEAELTKARIDAGFGKYSKHNFKFFYLERGRGASNCEITFNLVPATHNFAVGKRLPNQFEAADEHMWYQFRAEVQLPDKERQLLANTSYAVVEWKPGDDPISGGYPIRAAKTDENGCFWLKAGERANFMGVVDLKEAGVSDQEKVQIIITEIVPNDRRLSRVTAWDGDSERAGTYLEVPNPANAPGTTAPMEDTRKLIPPLYDEQFHSEANQKKLIEIMNEKEVQYQAVLTSGRHNEFNWVDFENDLGALSGLNITKVARNHDGTPIDDPFSIRIELWDTKENMWMPLPVGSAYWILQENQMPTDETKQQLNEGDKGLIQIRNGQWIHLHILPGTKYRVSEVLPPEQQKIYTTTYEGKNTRNEGFAPVLDAEGKQIGICNENGIAAGSQHNVIVTNRPNAPIPVNGVFTLTKQLVGAPLSEETSKFDFYLGIRDYLPGEGTQKVTCTASYQNTPNGVERTGASKQGDVWVQTITFWPDDAEKFAANLFLYPGETVSITDLPEGCSVYVREDLPDNQNEKYDVTFQEKGWPSISGHELSTKGTIAPNGMVEVICTNTSKAQTTANTLQITKTVKRTDIPSGEPTAADKEKEFSFSVTLKNPTDFTGGEMKAEIRTADGTIRNVSLNFTENGADYTAKVQLKHGETLTIIGLPNDVDVVVQETNHEGYTVSMNQTSGDSMTVHFASGQSKLVECVNMTGVKIPETGGHGRLPYYLVGGVLMCAAALLLYHRRKDQGSV